VEVLVGFYSDVELLQAQLATAKKNCEIGTITQSEYDTTRQRLNKTILDWLKQKMPS